MIEFLLNDKLVRTNVHPGMLLLDFIREDRKLKGTKSACREGDCGSCTVIIGKQEGEKINYKAVASCLMPIGNVHGKHVFTIEGLNMTFLSPIQKALVDQAAIQCGYCTPGIVLSLTAYLLSNTKFSFNSAINALGGNICRCTGYKSIKNTVNQLINDLVLIRRSDQIQELIELNYIPAYFCDVPKILKSINHRTHNYDTGKIVGGGTDLFVQHPFEMEESTLKLVTDEKQMSGIQLSGDDIIIGGACKISDLAESEIIKKGIPGFEEFIRLFASQIIRNMATVAGNIANASPIGDLSILFLALDTRLLIENEKKELREVKLRNFFKSYKIVDLIDNELIKSIIIKLPNAGFKFNFEKVSKRKYLDIASVNTACLISRDRDIIKSIQLSIGGVSPIPLYLEKTCKAMSGKILDEKLILHSALILDEEISPITDVRGSAEYKRLLARQLFFAHFVELFPNKFDHEKLIIKM